MFFVSERQIILYNPVENAVVYASPVRFQFSCRSRDNGVRFTLEVYNSAAPSEITADVRSLFSCRAKREHVAREGRGAFRFTRVSENGNSLVALVNPRCRCPFRRIALIPQRDGDIEFTIDEISVGKDVGDTLPRFPSKATLIKKVPLIDWARIENRQEDDFAALVNCFISGHLAMQHEGARAEYEEQRGARVNWADVAARDRITSLAVKNIVQRAIDAKK